MHWARAMDTPRARVRDRNRARAGVRVRYAAVVDGTE